MYDKFGMIDLMINRVNAACCVFGADHYAHLIELIKELQALNDLLKEDDKAHQEELKALREQIDILGSKHDAGRTDDEQN